jgi:hypothetical protein
MLVDARTRQRVAIDGAVGCEPLGRAIERGLGDTERLADIADRRARAVANDVAASAPSRRRIFSSSTETVGFVLRL